MLTWLFLRLCMPKSLAVARYAYVFWHTSSKKYPTQSASLTFLQFLTIIFLLCSVTQRTITTVLRVSAHMILFFTVTTVHAVTHFLSSLCDCFLESITFYILCRFPNIVKTLTISAFPQLQQLMHTKYHKADILALALTPCNKCMAQMRKVT